MKTSKAEESDGRENSITIQLAPLGISVFSCTPTEPKDKEKEKTPKSAKTNRKMSGAEKTGKDKLNKDKNDKVKNEKDKAGKTAVAAAERLYGLSDKFAEAKAEISSKIINFSARARKHMATMEEKINGRIEQE